MCLRGTQKAAERQQNHFREQLVASPTDMIVLLFAVLLLSACLSSLQFFKNWTHPFSNSQALFSDSSHMKECFDYFK